ncbi:MAG: 3'-5' exonuclease [Sideroxyarcus sp.]|nr:3'-5' exonuclease [Sideroxyarcus sp.]
MRALLDVTPTPEQLSLFSRVKSGVEVIRGAAGSGKTTTALLKLRSTLSFFINRKRRQNRVDPIRILVLTYNRTLSGYISELANQQVPQSAEINLEIMTFGKWAMSTLGRQVMIDDSVRSGLITQLGSSIELPTLFIEEEVDYLLGRFMPDDINKYLTVRRDGRGGTPRMDQPQREALIANVVQPFIAYKKKHRLKDWNDLAVELAETKHQHYDVVIVDETQDFSANQIRAVMNQLMDTHSVTFILDTVQRIYSRGFTWQEVGIQVRPENSFRLAVNYRNTKEIAAFAASLLNGLGTDDDGTMPNFAYATGTGIKPKVLKGQYNKQVSFAIKTIKSDINLSEESIAFLHPKGGGWFDRPGGLRNRLGEAGLPFVEITRESDWPQGTENIALSTLHSAKGLEFDHVFILGLNKEVLPHGDGTEDERLSTLRRLLAMGIGRAKKSVVLGYAPDDVSSLFDFFDKDTYEEHIL